MLNIKQIVLAPHITAVYRDSDGSLRRSHGSVFLAISVEDDGTGVITVGDIGGDALTENDLCAVKNFVGLEFNGKEVDWDGEVYAINNEK